MEPSFYTFPTDAEARDYIMEMVKTVPNLNWNDDRNTASITSVHRNVKFNAPRYACIAENEKLVIYFLEGDGGLIFSLEDITTLGAEHESGFIVNGEHVEINPGFACMVTFSCTSPSNIIVTVKEVYNRK
ncbi:EFc-like protein [Turkeypox virus]|uniref:EFc-like protein n=1 Tax=Turkeypox virus TaxID=336486 RepID=A0A0M3ZCW6_9POXV|nr:EFc-like protein [Turkeypox virus]ALA62542.1 EFc-like protein [Turkeypox virus]